MPALRWQTVIDFVVLTGAIYLLLRWAKQARAVRIAMGIIGLHAASLVARNYDLAITNWVLSIAGYLAIAVLLVVFQPELRRAFMRLDSMIRSGWQRPAVLMPAFRAIAQASFDLAHEYIGALIVIVRSDAITELIQGGTPLGAEVSGELLQAIFQKNSPMHDGAVLIDGSVLTRAQVVLPLTQRTDVPPYYGTRHRAAMGLAERSDALTLAISEQRGTVTLIRDRKIQEIENAEALATLLERLYSRPELGWAALVRSALTRNLRFKLAAVALAAAVWTLTILTTGTTVRVLQVPLAFTAVPAGMTVGGQSTSELSIQIRGNALVMDSASLNRMVATVNLNGARPGAHTLRIGPGNFDLPPGIRFERATPPAVSVKLTPRSH